MSTTRLYCYRGKTNSYCGEIFYRYIANDKISSNPSCHIKKKWSGKVIVGVSPSITLKIKTQGSKICVFVLIRLVHFDMQPCVNWAQQMSCHKGASTDVFFPPWSSQGLRSSHYRPGMTGSTVPAHPRTLGSVTATLGLKAQSRVSRKNRLSRSEIRDDSKQH